MTRKDWKPERRIRFIVAIAVVLVALFVAVQIRDRFIGATNLPKGTEPAKTTPLVGTSTLALTPTPGATNTLAAATNTPAVTSSPGATATLAASATPGTGGTIAPYPSAPLCPDVGPLHNTAMFHTLWDGVRGCHYDHEHGISPFTQAITDTFPGVNLKQLLGNVEIGNTNPSSPIENTTKHGGFKWQVQLTTPFACGGYQSSTYGISALAVEFHEFGNASIEFGARVHSASALLRECSTSNPTDYGYIFTTQLLDYGQRVVPYQGDVLPYPNTPNPAYNSALAPYLTGDCVNPADFRCRTSLQFVLSRSINSNSIWTSQNPERLNASGTNLVKLLFRLRDESQLVDTTGYTSATLTYPFKFDYLCSNDGGVTYTAIVGCRYVNATATIHEIYGTVPTAWSTASVFTSTVDAGGYTRLTGLAYTDKLGALNLACAASGPDCYPIVMLNAFVGTYGAHLIPDKISQFSLAAQTSRDIFFCGQVQCNEGDPGAQSSGWIGVNN